MKTIRTTDYEYDAEGHVSRTTDTYEELPACHFLRIDGLTEDQIAHLVAVRDAFHKGSN